MKLVQDRGGVVRTRVLRAQGYGRRRIDRALGAGLLTRIREGWVATPDADPYLIAAARGGVVITCVTQAKRLGLWVLSEDRPHVGAPAHSGSVSIARRIATVHWSKPIVPRHPDALEDPIENVLALVGACQPYEAALAIWESALRTGLATKQALANFPFVGQARLLAAEASPYSDSGLETFVVPRLRWLKLSIIPQAYIAGHRVDFLIGERLVFQVDGAHHVGVQRASDNEHDTRLMLLGYHVIRVGFIQMIDRWPTVQDMIMRAIAQGLHLAR